MDLRTSCSDVTIITNMSGLTAEKLPSPEPIAFPRLDQLTVAGIEQHAACNLDVANYLLDGIKSAHGAGETLTWDNTGDSLEKALEALGYEGEGGRWPMLMAAVHPDETIRKEAGKAYGSMDAAMLDLYADAELYGAFRAFAESEAAGTLQGEEALALAAVMREFRLAGHELGEGERSRLRELRGDLQELASDFGANMKRDTGEGLRLEEAEKGEFTPEQLDSFLRRDKKGNVPDPNDHRLPLDKPSVDSILENHPNRGLRRKLYEAYSSIGAPENQELLTKIAAKRHEIANKILGYNSWSELQTEGQLLGNPEEVLASYRRLQPGITEEVGQLLADIKQRFSLDHDVEQYDIPYYVTQMRKELDARLDGLFPYDNVMNGISGIAKDLFGVEVREVTESPERHEGKWHDSVRFYEIQDADGTLLGRFGVDPHPRPGTKRGGAATYTLQDGCQKEPGGEHNIPVTVIVANLTGPSTGGEQAQLNTYDVRVLLHEFGHVLHTTFGKTRGDRLGGSNNIEEDFREMVSVFFEGMTDDPDTLRYLGATELPSNVLEDYAKAQRIKSLLLAQRNLRSGWFDLALHSAGEELSVDKLEAIRLQAEEFSQILEGEAGAGWTASFRHALTNQYAGRIQVYTWAYEQREAIRALFGQAGDSHTKAHIGRHLRMLMERGGTERGSTLFDRFMQNAQQVVRRAATVTGLGSKATSEST